MKKEHILYALHQKLENIKLSEEGQEGQKRLKVGLLNQLAKLNAKEIYLKEIKSTTPLNTQMIGKLKNLTDDMEKILVVWLDQMSQSITSVPNMIRSEPLDKFCQD